MKNLLIIFVFFIGYHSFAQSNENSYAEVDSFVARQGAMNASDFAFITDKITRPFDSKEKKARAIYFWITQNISIDPRGTKFNDQKNNAPEKVLQRRTATPTGFASVFQEMCSQANVRCLIVNGYKKSFTEDINEIPEEPADAWNVVQLGISPEDWYYVDAFSGAGFLDKRKTNFYKKFSSCYFFADKKIFNLQHYPENKSWLLSEGPKNLKEFYSLPIIDPSAYAYKLDNINPPKGRLKYKTGKKYTFALSFKETSNIQNLSIQLSEGKKIYPTDRLNINRNGNTVSFEYGFKKATEYVLNILTDDVVLLSYIIEVNE